MVAPVLTVLKMLNFHIFFSFVIHIDQICTKIFFFSKEEHFLATMHLVSWHLVHYGQIPQVTTDYIFLIFPKFHAK